MIVYRQATFEDLEKIWNKDIEKNDNEECWIRWKHQYKVEEYLHFFNLLIAFYHKIFAEINIHCH